LQNGLKTGREFWAIFKFCGKSHAPPARVQKFNVPRSKFWAEFRLQGGLRSAGRSGAWKEGSRGNEETIQHPGSETTKDANHTKAARTQETRISAEKTAARRDRTRFAISRQSG
jgi:hypothetical protein